MRRRALIVAVLVAAVLAPTGSAAVTRNVSVKFRIFNPAQLVAITGDTVKWQNNETSSSPSLSNHNLISDDGITFNAPLPKGASFSQVFSTPGVIHYHCSLHPGMHGTLTVSDLYLAKVAVVTYGKPVTLSGYAQEGATVDINLENGTANPVKTVTANATTGKFTASIPAVPGRYQATDGTHTSAFVRLTVKPRLNVKSTKKNGKYTIAVSTSPNQAGGKIVLERKQGSKWVKIATHTLPAASKTAFTVKPKVTMKVRVRLSVAKNGYATTASGTLTLRK